MSFVDKRLFLPVCLVGSAAFISPTLLFYFEKGLLVIDWSQALYVAGGGWPWTSDLLVSTWVLGLKVAQHHAPTDDFHQNIGRELNWGKVVFQLWLLSNMATQKECRGFFNLDLLWTKASSGLRWDPFLEVCRTVRKSWNSLNICRHLADFLLHTPQTGWLWLYKSNTVLWLILLTVSRGSYLTFAYKTKILFY